MPITVMLKATLKENQQNKLEDLMRESLVETRKYEGFRDITIYQEDNSNNIVFYSIWDKKEHYENYLNYRIQTGDIDTLAQFFENKPQISFYNDLKL